MESIGWGFLGTAHTMEFHNPIFYGHIQVLLIQTDPMIYICYIKYRMNTACVFAVGDDDDASLEAATT